MSAHNKKGWLRSASLRDKRCSSLEADAQANPELALVDSFARQVGYARNPHVFALLVTRPVAWLIEPASAG